MSSTTFVNSFVFKEVKYNLRHSSVINGLWGHNYVMYLQKGNAVITTETETFCLKPGDILHIPRGSSYATEFTGEPEIRFGSYAYLNCPGECMHNFKMQKVNRTCETDRLIKLVSEESGVNRKAIGYFYLFLEEMTKNLIPSSFDKKSEILEKAMQYIRRMPDKKIPDAAAYCGISEAGLYNLFRENPGTSPGDFRMNVKLENAYTYVVTTRMPIEEISDLCGFSSSSYFRKKFVARYGTSPRNIRKRNGK